MTNEELKDEIEKSQSDVLELYRRMQAAAFRDDTKETFRVALVWCDQSRRLDALYFAAKLLKSKEGKAK